MGKCICKNIQKNQSRDIFIDSIVKDSLKKYSEISKIKTMATFHRTKKFLKVKTLKFECKLLRHLSTEKMMEQKQYIKSIKRSTTIAIKNKRLQLFPPPSNSNLSNLNKQDQTTMTFLHQKSINDSSNFHYLERDDSIDSSLNDQENSDDKSSNGPKESYENSEYSSLPISYDEEQKFFNSIRQNILFSNFSEEMFTYIMEMSEGLEVEKGSIIYQEGEDGNSLFMIKSGSVELISSMPNDEKKKLGPGDCFGEIALLQMNVNRFETAKAMTNVVLLYIEGEQYRKVLKILNNSNPIERIMNYIDGIVWLKYLEPLIKFRIALMMQIVNFKKGEIIIEKNQFSTNNCYIIQKGCFIQNDDKHMKIIGCREMVGDLEIFLGISGRRAYEIKSIEDTICYVLSKQSLIHIIGDSYQDQILMVIYNQALANNNFFQRIIMKNQIESVFRLNTVKQYCQNEIVFETSREKNKKVILILKGSISVKDQSSEELLGQLFGEEIITKSKDLDRAITATETLTVLEAEWKSICNNMKKFAQTTGTLDISKTAKVLEKTRPFGSLSKKEILEISSLFTEVKRYKKDDIIIEKNSIINCYYLVTKGKVSISDDEDKTVREINQGNSFGEIFLLNNKKCTFCARAITEVICYILPKESFIKCLEYEKLNEYTKNKMCLEDNNVELKDLYLISHLGKGKFGNVHLVHNGISLYAIKSVQLSFSKHDKVLGKYLFMEKKILLGIDHPFIVKLVKTFKKDTTCFFLMEYINSINLEKYIISRMKSSKKQDMHKNIMEAKFYGASLFLALDYLNHKMICHRDIKPSNIMIDNTGYIKLIDFGASKIFKDITFTVAGTPNCIAPEVLHGKGYSFPCDFWSVGIVLFYIIFGKYPYKHNSNVMELYKEVVNGEIEYPKQDDIKVKEVMEFLQKLLRKNPIGRLCSLNKIQEDPFFYYFNWKDLNNLKVKPEDIPFKKVEYNDEDTKKILLNFTSRYETAISAKIPLSLSTIILRNQFIYNSILEDKSFDTGNNTILSDNNVNGNIEGNIANGPQCPQLLNLFNKYLKDF